MRGAVRYRPWVLKKYEDYTRMERARLLINDPDAYYALLGPDQWFLILDGMARTKPYVPPLEETEQPGK